MLRLSCSDKNRKAGITLFAINKMAQTMRFRQAVIEHSDKHGGRAAAVPYRLKRQYIYRRRKRYDGTLKFLADRSHRPHSHPNQHTADEIKLILNMKRGNPVVFWVKPRNGVIPDLTQGCTVFVQTRSNGNQTAKPEVYTKAL